MRSEADAGSGSVGSLEAGDGFAPSSADSVRAVERIGPLAEAARDPDADLRRRILVDNPAGLYGFEARS